MFRYHTAGCEAYSFTTDEYGIFNVSPIFGRVPYTRRAGPGTNKSAPRVDSEGQKKTQLTAPWPDVGLNPGSWYLNTDDLPLS